MMEEKTTGDEWSSDVTADFTDLDIQHIAPAEALEKLALRRLVEEISDLNKRDADPALSEWAAALLVELPVTEGAADPQSFARTYTTYQLSATSGTRTYRLQVRVDDEFGNLRESLRDRVQTMLDRAVVDQTGRFIARAKAVGMDEGWRRSNSSPFPHVLPYLKPAPTAREGKQAEEAGVVTAAVHFALSRSGMRLDVNQYSQGPTIKPSGAKAWSCGYATVNSYNWDQVLVINLNERAIREAGFSNNFWTGTVAHEVLHTLGWGHPNGKYPDDLPIEIWQWCIQTAGGALVEEPSDVVAIR
jgi:hypothetical protein